MTLTDPIVIRPDGYMWSISPIRHLFGYRWIEPPHLSSVQSAVVLL
jgi:hypothetical protein